MKKIYLDKIPLTLLGEDEFETEIIKIIQSEKPHQIVTFNSLMFIEAKKNPAFLDAIINSDLVIPESSGVAWALKFLYNMTVPYMAGIDLTHRILSLAEKRKMRLYLVGATSDVITRACERIKLMYPAVSVAGYRDGYFSNKDSPDVVKTISSSGADILLVGLGIPKQEIWINQNKEKLNIKIAMGVGGSFDVISGKLKRAPALFRRFGCEWFYRLIQEPSRISRMKNLPLFVWEMIKLKIKQQ